MWCVSFGDSKILISRIYFVCLRLYLLCSKVESVGHCLCGKVHHEAVHAHRNYRNDIMFRLASRAEAPMWKLVFSCQSKDGSLFILIKTKHFVYIMIFVEVISYDDSTPLFILPYGLRLNTHINCMDLLVQSSIGLVTDGRTIPLTNVLCVIPHKQKITVLAFR